MQRSDFRLTAIASVLALTSACSEPKEQEPNLLLSPELHPAPIGLPIAESPSPAAPPTLRPAPSPNYDEKRDSTYYYIAAVSDEDRKRGRAVGNVSAFQYLGKNGDGEHILASLTSDGRVAYKAKCAASCRIIDTDYGDKIPYSPSSIIGAAFEDAFRGRLQAVEWAKTIPPANRVVVADPALEKEAPLDPAPAASPPEDEAQEQIEEPELNGPPATSTSQF